MPHGKSPRHQSRKKARKQAGKQAGTKPPKKAAAGSVGQARSHAQAETGSAEETGHAASAVGPAASGSMRLQKLLASAGFGSRREVEQFLLEERVTVNGRVATLGDRADPSVDDIRFDGERLLKERPAYWIVNKPRGVVTTVRDNEGRRTVVDLIPRSAGRLFPVGRLDRETSGLLLMTNDGDAAHVLLHPSLGNEREYRVNVKGQLDARAVKRLERGVTLDEGRTSPARVSDVRFDSDSGTSSMTLTLSEGKKRQIRRSLLVLGFPVRRLVRVRMGPLRLGRLAVGETRPLRPEEKRALLEHVRRLRAGEAPETLSTRSDSARRTDAAHKAPASFPRHKPTRRARGESETAGQGGRSGGGGATPRKRAAKRKPAAKPKQAASREGGASRKPAGAKQRAKKAEPGAGPKKTRSARSARSESGSQDERGPSSKARTGKSAAVRKPSKASRQRTPASRKGPRR